MASESTEFLSELLENSIKLFPHLRFIRDTFRSIINIIPQLFRTTDDLSKKYIYNGTELILLVLSIVIIDQYKHESMLIPETPEGIIFILFLCILLLNVIHTTYLYIFGRDVEGIALVLKQLIYNIPLYTIVFVFSLVVWIVFNLFGWIQFVLNNFSSLLNTIFEKIGEILSNPEDAKTFYKYGGLYAIIFIIIIIMYYAAFDPKALTTKAFSYTMAIAIPLILIFAVVKPYAKKQGGGATIFIIAAIASFFIAIFYFFSKANANSYKLMNYIAVVVGILLLIGGLAIIFYIMSNYLKSLSGWTGFVVYFIFYLPCLFIDFIKYFLNELKMTSNPIFVLLLVEIILIVLYVYLPWILKKFNSSSTFELLPGSAFLDIEQTIGSAEINKLPKFMEKLNNLDNQQIYNQNYAFSMWIYLNSQTNNYIGNTNESQIFNYGDGKPKVTYYKDSTGKDMYRVYFTNASVKQPYYEFSMPVQKWNNLVMNFTSTQADLFVNGKLEKTYLFAENPPNYVPTDFVVIGKNNSGLDGAICNIVYHPKNVSIIEIANNYNLLSMRNPPTYK